MRLSAVMLVCAVLVAGCGADEPETASLMPRLEQDAAVGDGYVAALDGGGALMIVVDGDQAVGYRCEPLRAGVWFTGIRDGDALKLESPDGATTLEGTLEGATLTVGGTELRRSDTALLLREPDAGERQPSGLIAFEGRVAGMVNAAPGSDATVGVSVETDSSATLVVPPAAVSQSSAAVVDASRVTAALLEAVAASRRSQADAIAELERMIQQLDSQIAALKATAEKLRNIAEKVKELQAAFANLAAKQSASVVTRFSLAELGATGRAVQGAWLTAAVKRAVETARERPRVFRVVPRR